MPSIIESYEETLLLGKIFWPQAGFEPALRGVWDKPSTTEPWDSWSNFSKFYSCRNDVQEKIFSRFFHLILSLII